MALLAPHPALKVAAPESPMVDGWMGDDWFHYGAFRQTNFDYFQQPDRRRRARASRCRAARMTTTRTFRRAGSAGDYAEAHGLDQLPLGTEDDGPSGVRRLLAGPGARQADRATSLASAHDVDPGLVGPGGHVGRDPLLPGAEGEGPGGPQLSGDGAVAAQPGELRAAIIWVR